MFKFLSNFYKIAHKLIMKYYKIKMFKICSRHGYNIRVNNKVRVNSKTVLGNNISFNGLYVVGEGEVYIGDNIHIAPECLIITQNHNYKGKLLPFDNKNITKNVKIEDNPSVSG